MKIQNTLRRLCASACIFALAAGPLAAQSDPAGGGSFVLELNNATDTAEGGCQLTFVSVNESDEGLTEATFQAGIFDSGGIVTQLVLFEFGALPAGKTLIVPFTLPAQACADISRVIVNAVARCTTADGSTSAICSSGLVTRTLAGIAFSS